MSRNLIPLTVAAALLGGTAMADVPKVVADITPVQSLVARVMQGVGEPSVVVAPGASPHGYSLRPSEAAALQEADLVFWVGPELEPWLADAIETLAGDAKATELLEIEGTTELATRENALFEAHHHDEHAEGEDHDAHDHEEHAEGEDHDDHDHDEHAEGEDHDDHDEHDDHEGHHHGTHDPHAWLSPDNGAVWLNAIAAQLSAADPENAGAYYANAAAGREELAALNTEINAILDPVRGRNFIVFHDAYQYFETAYEFYASGSISLSDASDPSPARIAEIQTRIKEQNVTCVFTEPQFNPGIIAAVTDGANVQTGVMDPLGADLETGVSLYPQLLRNLATSLANCL